jgi:2-octaprenyl-6-methoxyphenol hydroxylase
MKNINSDVAIIGAGMGGLSAGIALARSGLNVVALEARREPTTDHWGFTLWPPATRTLDSLGVLDQVIARGCRLKALRWLKGDGHEWMSVNLERLSDVGLFIGILPSELAAVLRCESSRSGLQIMEGVEGLTYEKEGLGNFRIRAVQGDEQLSISTRFIVGADGPMSFLRQRVGGRAWRWRPPGQVILTGIGGALDFAESRQAFGAGWSGGAVNVGKGKSWLYAIVLGENSAEMMKPIKFYGNIDTEARTAMVALDNVIAIRPWSWRVERWAADGVLLIGDAAHCMLPHIGLGGTMTLEDVPVLTEVVNDALTTGKKSAAALDSFRRRRLGRVAYARRISELWALSVASRVPGLGRVRDRNFKRLSKHSELLETFVRELSGSAPTSWRTRIGMWLP